MNIAPGHTVEANKVSEATVPCARTPEAEGGWPLTKSS